MFQYESSARSASDADAKLNTTDMLNPAKGFAVFGAAAQSVMRGNQELMSLASRRVGAQMDLPRKALACRTAPEFGQLAVNFWREAFQDVVDCNQRLIATWTQTLTDAGQGDFARSMTGMANVALQPIATVAEEAGVALAEHPTEPWAWWRTDMKGLKPARNGHHREPDGLRVGP